MTPTTGLTTAKGRSPWLSNPYTRRGVGELCERLEARGTSQMLRDQPELCSDLRSAAALLRFMLDQGMPVTSIGVDMTNGPGEG
jgi:hypothetical protein